jgi:hypothetical protein
MAKRDWKRPEGPPRVCELDARILAGIVVLVVVYWVLRQFDLEQLLSFWISAGVGFIFAIAIE